MIIKPIYEQELRNHFWYLLAYALNYSSGKLNIHQYRYRDHNPGSGSELAVASDLGVLIQLTVKFILILMQARIFRDKID